MSTKTKMDYDTAYAIWRGRIGATEPEYLEMSKLVSEVILKQIPKKPKLIRYSLSLFDESDVYQCECGCCVGSGREHGLANYCFRCGQAIDWSDIDEE